MTSRCHSRRFFLAKIVGLTLRAINSRTGEIVAECANSAATRKRNAGAAQPCRPILVDGHRHESYFRADFMFERLGFSTMSH
jgi:hypothetical protein